METTTMLVADCTNQDNSTNDLLILNPLIINKSLAKTDDAIKSE